MIVAHSRTYIPTLAAKSDETRKAEKKARRKAWEKDQKEAALKKKQLHPNKNVEYIEREDGVWEERRLTKESVKPKPCKANDDKPTPKKQEKETRKPKLDRQEELKRAGYRRGIFPLSELLSVKMKNPHPPPPEWVEAEIRQGMSSLGEGPWAWIEEGLEEREEDFITLDRDHMKRSIRRGRRVTLPTQPWKDKRGLREYRSQRGRKQEDEDLD